MFNSINSYIKKSLYIAHLNIRSIGNKLDELKMFLVTKSIDIMLLNETMLTPSKKLSIPNYKIVRKDRQNRRGGGICFIIHDSIDHCLRSTDLTLPTDECLAIEFPALGSQNQPLILVAYYSPPQVTVNQDLLNKLFDTNERVILIGDLNAHHQSWHSKINNPSGEIISDSIEKLDLVIINDSSPTYLPEHKPNYTAIIDLAISTENAANLVTNFETTDCLRSDHITILLTISHDGLINIGAPPISYRKKVKIKSINQDKLSDELSHFSSLLKYPEIKSHAMIDNIVSQLTISIQASIEYATVEKSINVDQNKLLVLPRKIVELIKVKRKLRRKYYSTQNPHFKKEYNLLNSRIRQEIQIYKTDKWRSFCSSLNEFSVSDSKLWKSINSINKSDTKKEIAYASISGV